MLYQAREGAGDRQGRVEGVAAVRGVGVDAGEGLRPWRHDVAAAGAHVDESGDIGLAQGGRVDSGGVVVEVATARRRATELGRASLAGGKLEKFLVVSFESRPSRVLVDDDLAARAALDPEIAATCISIPFPPLRGVSGPVEGVRADDAGRPLAPRRYREQRQRVAARPVDQLWKLRVWDHGGVLRGVKAAMLALLPLHCQATTN